MATQEQKFNFHSFFRDFGFAEVLGQAKRNKF